MAKTPKTVEKLNVTSAFTAAAVAHRINGGEYVKPGALVADPDSGPYALVPNPKRPNKELATAVLAGEIQPTDGDMEFAQAIMTHYRGLTFQLLSGKTLNDFNTKAMQTASNEEMPAYDLAFVVSLPSCYAREIQRKGVDDRLYDCERGYIGNIGQKLTVTGEVVRVVFSQQWNTYYATIITDTNHAVFFSSRSNLAVGSTITLQGKVKAHQEGYKTQFNYTKII